MAFLSRLSMLFRRHPRNASRLEFRKSEFSSNVEVDGDDDLDSIIFPPCTTDDPTVWDQHWQRWTDHGFGPFVEMFVDDRAFAIGMQNSGLRTVLCVGNGPSQEPKALAAAGLEVTVLDFSPMALRICEEADFDDQYRRNLLDDELMRPGGSVSYVVGDIMDPNVCPGPYDLIIERRTVQLFAEKMSDALAALAKRLSDDGVFFSHCHNGGWRPGEKREAITERWFRDQGWAIFDGQNENDEEQSGRTAWILFTTG